MPTTTLNQLPAKTLRKGARKSVKKKAAENKPGETWNDLEQFEI